MRAAVFRLAFVAASTAYLAGVVALARWQGWLVAVGVVALAFLLAMVLAEDWSPEPTREPEWPRTRRERMRRWNGAAGDQRSWEPAE